MFWRAVLGSGSWCVDGVDVDCWGADYGTLSGQWFERPNWIASSSDDVRVSVSTRLGLLSGLESARHPSATFCYLLLLFELWERV